MVPLGSDRMNAPQPIGAITATMLKRCTYCNAMPMQPCKTPGTRRELRFTHAERNR